MKRKKLLFGICMAVCTIVLSVNMMVNVEASTLNNDKYRTFKKTKNKCTKCSCSGYWGYKHGNGTYEGNCSNSDSWGHACGHGPEKHGLKKW